MISTVCVFFKYHTALLAMTLKQLVLVSRSEIFEMLGYSSNVSEYLSILRYQRYIYQQLSSTYVCGSLERGPLDDKGRQHDIRINGGEIGDFAEDLDSLDENGGD